MAIRHGFGKRTRCFRSGPSSTPDIPRPSPIIVAVHRSSTAAARTARSSATTGRPTRAASRSWTSGNSEQVGWSADGYPPTGPAAPVQYSQRGQHGDDPAQLGIDRVGLPIGPRSFRSMPPTASAQFLPAAGAATCAGTDGVAVLPTADAFRRRPAPARQQASPTARSPTSSTAPMPAVHRRPERPHHPRRVARRRVGSSHTFRSRFRRPRSHSRVKLVGPMSTRRITLSAATTSPQRRRPGS